MIGLLLKSGFGFHHRCTFRVRLGTHIQGLLSDSLRGRLGAFLAMVMLS